MTGTMLDALYPQGHEGLTADVYAGYIDHPKAPDSFDTLTRMHSSGLFLPICIDPNDTQYTRYTRYRIVGLDVGDTGTATPQQAPEWCRRVRLENMIPVVYVNQTYGWGPCKTAFDRTGIPEPYWWVAHYNRPPTPIPAGADILQYGGMQNPTTKYPVDTNTISDLLLTTIRKLQTGVPPTMTLLPQDHTGISIDVQQAPIIMHGELGSKGPWKLNDVLAYMYDDVALISTTLATMQTEIAELKSLITALTPTPTPGGNVAYTMTGTLTPNPPPAP